MYARYGVSIGIWNRWAVMANIKTFQPVEQITVADGKPSMITVSPIMILLKNLTG